MTGHPDPADLAEFALAGGVLDEADPRVREHLRTCDACRGELDSLRRLVRAVRSATPSDLVGPPPPGVWARLARETGEGRLPAPGGGRPSAPAEGRSSVPEAGGPARRTGRGGAALRITAAVLAVAAGGGAAAWCRRRRRAARATVR
ncbi:hypothetical protein [Streptomyces sp. WMMC940]|uniref:hypothetical protein n=1 Tax=Streptomyces sp. WMMC940 TaxID=3015153 RepID=UPI0022B6C825|nr:hypothetical protein [Streptomyces sp. WMMC940]MCZ7457217.1 hypothetical protein [Streptomyces sp. WMMC940]